jgi:hypothetical protein
MIIGCPASVIGELQALQAADHLRRGTAQLNMAAICYGS